MKINKGNDKKAYCNLTNIYTGSLQRKIEGKQNYKIEWALTHQCEFEITTFFFSNLGLTSKRSYRCTGFIVCVLRMIPKQERIPSCPVRNSKNFLFYVDLKFLLVYSSM